MTHLLNSTRLLGTLPSLDEQQEFRQQVKEFAQREIAPLAQSIDHNNNTPASVWKAIGEMGLLGTLVQHAAGGILHLAADWG